MINPNLKCLAICAAIAITTACAPKHYETRKLHHWSIIDTLQQHEKEALLYHTTTLLLSTESNSDRIKTITEQVENNETKSSNKRGIFSSAALSTSLICVILLGGGLYLRKKIRN